MPEENDHIHNMADHDLLIALHTKMGFLQSSVEELKDSLASRVDALEAQKLDAQRAQEWKKGADIVHNDLTEKLDKMRMSYSNFAGRIAPAGTIVLIVFSGFISYLFSHAK